MSFMSLSEVYLSDDPRSNGRAHVSQHEAAQLFVVLVQLE